MSSKKFPTDELDSLPEHGGRHRARRTSRDRIREFVRVLVAASIVAAVGLFGLRMVANSVQFDITTLPTTAPVVELNTGPGVTVLDNSDAAGAASALAHKLLDAGLNVLTAANYTSSTQVDQTVILISDESYRSTARKILKTMGKYPIEVTAEFTDPVTVVIGSDFAGKNSGTCSDCAGNIVTG